jgi:DNA-binding XRE family transcriptional regulator
VFDGQLKGSMHNVDNIVKGCPCKWLSEELGVRPSSVFKWYTNSSQPDIETLARISKLLSIGVEELYNKKFMESVSF